MKKTFTYLTLFVLCAFSTNAQIEVTADTEINITAVPTICYGTATECGDLDTEYFITNLDVPALDGMGFEIVGTAQGNNFTMTASSADLSTLVNFAVTPVCYDIVAIKLLVDAMNNVDPTCCNVINGLAPDIMPPVCDGIIALFSSGDQVNNLDDVLAVIAAFGSTSISITGFRGVADQVNDNAALLPLVCPGTTGIDYCVNPTDSVVYKLLTVGVEDLKEGFSGIIASPNPVNDVLTINFEETRTENVTIKVLNTIGQVVYTNTIKASQGSNNYQIEMASFDTGIYLLEVDNGAKKEIRKLIKK